MSFEAARKVLSKEISRLQSAQNALEEQIKLAAGELHRRKGQKEELLVQVKETVAALQALGGPLPDWTEDKDVIAFWDEIKDL